MLKAAICTAASPVILLLFSHNCRQYHRSKQLCSNIIFTFRFSYFAFSQVWFPTVQDVLHADWQDVWHSPHPPFLTVLFSVCVFSVLMCFIFTPPNFAHIAFAIIAHTARFLKYFFTHLSGSHLSSVTAYIFLKIFNSLILSNFPLKSCRFSTVPDLKLY